MMHEWDEHNRRITNPNIPPKQRFKIEIYDFPFGYDSREERHGDRTTIYSILKCKSLGVNKIGSETLQDGEEFELSLSRRALKNSWRTSSPNIKFGDKQTLNLIMDIQKINHAVWKFHYIKEINTL